MLDAYTHLDMTAADPIEDLRERMASGPVSRALIVETWSGDNVTCLERVIAERSSAFRVARCFRQEGANAFEDEMTVAIRVKTCDLSQLGTLAEQMVRTRKWLLPHAEFGISALKNALLPLAKTHPELNIYLPHLGWPIREKIDDFDWQTSMEELSSIRNLVVGVSAIEHFSRERYPHRDVQGFAHTVLDIFDRDAVVPGSDYPLFEKSQYSAYMELASAWIEGPPVSRFARSLFGEEAKEKQPVD
jgi:predicted TIM-barrel fold metal-dependent hydrolase